MTSTRAIWGALAVLAIGGCSLLTGGALEDKPPTPAPGAGGSGGEGGGPPIAACETPADCPGTDICIEGVCAAAHCSDGMQNEGETDEDCGGSCPPCAVGDGCEDAEDCVTNLCDEGLCASCGNNADCASTAETFCSQGDCVSKKDNGDPCFAGAECVSGHCAADDQTCCDQACDGCQACLGRLTGLTDGLCGPVIDGTDPHDACAEEPVASCGQTGACEGGACALHPDGAVCSDLDCSNGTATEAGTCDGLGDCSAGQPEPCGDYVCGATACLDSCSQPSHCSGANVCAGDDCVACGDPGAVTGSAADCPGAYDAATDTCTITCRGGQSGNCSGSVTCPAGVNCIIDCTDAQSCKGSTINCTDGHSCVVNCAPSSGNQSCQDATINCGSGPCTVNCSGDQGCDNTVVVCGVNSCDASCNGCMNGCSLSMVNTASSCGVSSSGC